MARKDKLSRRAAPCGQVSLLGNWKATGGPGEECIRSIRAMYVPRLVLNAAAIYLLYAASKPVVKVMPCFNTPLFPRCLSRICRGF